MDLNDLLAFFDQYDWIVALFIAPFFWALVKVLYRSLILAPTKFLWKTAQNFIGSIRSERGFTFNYLQALESQLNDLPQIGISNNFFNSPLHLEEVFVKCKLQNFSQIQDKNSETSIDKETFTIGSALRSYKRLVVLGDPGSGKTTLAQWICLTYARNFNSQVDKDVSLVTERLGLDENIFPLLITVRKVGDDVFSSIENLVKNLATSNDHFAYPVMIIAKLLKQGRCLIVVDGLDEVLNLKTRRRLVDDLEKFVGNFPQNRYLITSRVVGYEEAALGIGFHALRVLPLTKVQMSEYIFKLLEATNVTSSGKGKVSKTALRDRSSSLLQVIEAHSSVRELGGTPLLLTILVMLSMSGLDVPREKAQLYNGFVEMLLERWDEQRSIQSQFPKTPLYVKRRILSAFAFATLSKRQLNESKDTVLETMRDVLQKNGIRSENAEAFLQELISRSGLLMEIGLGRIGFAHRSFQEFFAAVEVNRTDPKGWVLDGKLDDELWYEVLLFFCGLGDSTEFISRLISGEKDLLDLNLLLAAECATQSLFLDSGVRNTLELRLLDLVWPKKKRTLHSVWRKALSLISHFNNQELSKTLKGELYSENSRARSLAALAIGYMRQDILTTNLLTTISDKSVTVRRSSIQALEEMGGKGVVGSLLAQLEKEKDSVTRMLIVRSLPAFHPAESVKATCDLLKNNEDEEVRIHAAIALREFSDDRRVFTTLGKTLFSEKSGEVRGWIADSLARFGGETARKLLIKALLSDKSADAKESIALRLARFPALETKDALLLVQQDNKEYPFVRMRAAASLAELGDDRSHKFIFDSIEAGWSGSWAAAIGLEHIDTPETIQLCKSILKASKDPSLCRQAVSTLAKLRPSGWTKILHNTLLKNRIEIVRRDAAIRLGFSSSPDAILSLSAALRKEKSAMVRESIVVAFSRLNHKESLVSLYRIAIKDEDFQVRESAGYAVSLFLGRRSLNLVPGHWHTH